MTALNPLKGRNVRVSGVASEEYPSNLVCAHPRCTELVTLRPDGKPTVHHIFPRGLTKSKSYFVQITHSHGGNVLPDEGDTTTVIPHVVGLCGSGTTGHHGDVEEHRAWIKYEDGVFVWYEEITRTEVEAMGEVYEQYGQSHSLWRLVGLLNPQPAQSGKQKRSRLKGDERRKRRVISIKVPDDNENGGEVWDETFERVCDKLRALGLYDETTHIPVYEATIAAWNDWLNS